MTRVFLFVLSFLFVGCPTNPPKANAPSPEPGGSKVATTKPKKPNLSDVPREPAKYVPNPENEHEVCALSKECIESDKCTAEFMVGCVTAEIESDYGQTEFRVDGPCRLACVRAGLCEKTARGCVARNDEDCAASMDCGTSGNCKELDGHCLPKTDIDCQQSDLCMYDGGCRASGGRCVPLVDDDCRGPEKTPDRFLSPCREEERCTIVDGLCQATDCTARCKKDGHCLLQDKSVINGIGSNTYKVCAFDQTIDCNKTTDCKTDGLCVMETVRAPTTHRRFIRRCSATDFSCKESDVCKNSGRCFVRPGGTDGGKVCWTSGP